ncbi:hypothetical protein CRG98_013193 [Punica granatum]|uniref:Uncharacterized protein n=1 Tax=Punica granatum TaxID=22663 RepID=A0A2I0KCY9_PUNGR|nr:hypothetical protein CRG98_013193 [Punica granatum]
MSYESVNGSLLVSPEYSDVFGDYCDIRLSKTDSEGALSFCRAFFCLSCRAVIRVAVGVLCWSRWARMGC